MIIIKPQFNWSIMPTDNKFAISILILVSLSVTCKHIDKNKMVYTDTNGAVSSVFLSAKKIDQEGITFCCYTKLPVEKFVQCSGVFETPAEDEMKIPAPADGIIRSIFFPVGSYIQTGAILAQLENIEFIKLQQEFLEVQNQYNYFREDLKRQGELTIENASSIKKMQQVQLDFQIAEVKYYSLKAQLQLLGINPDGVDIEHFTSCVQITAPVSGYLSEINCSTNNFVGTGNVLFGIIKNKRLQIHLNVPEQHYKSLQQGQSVLYSTSNDSLVAFEAKILYIDKKINSKSHTFQVCACIPENMDYNLPGMSVKAKIKTYNDTIFIIPSMAIVHEISDAYLIIKKNNHFTRKLIKTGNSIGENSEVLEIPAAEENDTIVLNGLDYLNMLLTN
jgi:cobalt-zinc-cadmium efflux system membrane fusion protein